VPSFSLTEKNFEIGNLNKKNEVAETSATKAILLIKTDF
jgi:hypothetical protein